MQQNHDLQLALNLLVLFWFSPVVVLSWCSFPHTAAQMTEGTLMQRKRSEEKG